jgi:hypothetical protein
MKLNTINIVTPNPALLSIFQDNQQIITVDTNFFIAPDRSREAINIPSFDYNRFKEIWVHPLFLAFPKIAIHEAVNKEIVSSTPRQIVEEKLDAVPPELIIHKDSTLNLKEKLLRDAIERKIVPHTAYNPAIDNKDDRGEVKSLSYIAAKGLLYFCSHDSNAIRLVDKADQLATSLDNVQAIRTYEIIYFLYKRNLSNNEGLRILYKYLYFITPTDKKVNPSWGDFIIGMDKLYQGWINCDNTVDTI